MGLWERALLDYDKVGQQHYWIMEKSRKVKKFTFGYGKTGWLVQTDGGSLCSVGWFQRVLYQLSVRVNVPFWINVVQISM